MVTQLAQLFGKAIKKFKNPNQLDMFIVLGSEKEFAPGDKRKLSITKKGKKRWMDADEKKKEAKKQKWFEIKKPYLLSIKEFIRAKRKELGEHYLVDFEVGEETGAGVVGEEHKRLVKQAIEEGKIKSHPDYPGLTKQLKLNAKLGKYFMTMLDFVENDLASGRDFNSTIQSIRSGINTEEFEAIKQFYIDQKIINSKEEYIGGKPTVIPIEVIEKLSDDEIEKLKNGENWGTGNNAYAVAERRLRERSVPGYELLPKEYFMLTADKLYQKQDENLEKAFEYLQNDDYPIEHNISAYSGVYPVVAHILGEHAEMVRKAYAEGLDIPEKVLEFYEKSLKSDVQLNRSRRKKQLYKNTTWYRGVYSKNMNAEDKFYSASQEVAANYAIDRVGDKPKMELKKYDDLDMPKNPLDMPNKDVLATIIGFAEDPYTMRKFDDIAKNYAIKNGYDGILYEQGTFEEPELMVFGKTIEPEEWIEQQLSKYEKRQKFSIEPGERNPLVPIEIKFIPTRYKELDRVRAIAVGMDGEEEPASSSDIGSVVGRPFFQSETDRIPYIRLRLWLDNLISDTDAETEADTRMALRRTYYKQFGKAMKRNLFKAFGQQISMFNNTAPAPSREGETKQGKGGLLQLKKDKKSATKMRWQLADKQQAEGRMNRNNAEPASSQNIGRKTINTAKAYDLLYDKLGNKAIVTDKQGNEIGDGTFQLINENGDGTTTLFIKSKNGETKTISFQDRQAIQQNGDTVEFMFSDRNIGISLSEAGMNKKDVEQDPELAISEAERMKEFESRADSYMTEANRQKDKYLRDIDDIAEENGLQPTSYKYGRHAVKKRESIINKFKRNLIKGNPQKELTDILRGTIEIKNPEQFRGILDGFKKKGYEVWKDDLVNLYDDKRPGYKHIAVKLVSGKEDRIVKELLCITPNMLIAKKGFGHDLYELETSIDIALGNKVKEGHPLYPSLLRVKETVKKITNQFYKRAYYADMKGATLDNYDHSESTEASIAPVVDKVNNSSRKFSLGYDKPPKRLIRVLRSSLKTILQPLSASLRNSSGSMFNLDASSDMIDSSISSIINPTKNIIKKYAGILRNLYKSSNRGRTMRLIKAFGIQMNLFGEDTPTGTEKDGKRLEPSKKNPSVRRWQGQKETPTDIESDIRSEELDKLLTKKYGELSREEFIKYFDDLPNKLDLKEKHKNDFQAAKRRNILRDWNRKLSEGNVNPKFKGRVFSVPTFGIANNPNFQLPAKPKNLKQSSNLVAFLKSQGKDILLDPTDELADLVEKNYKRDDLPEESMVFANKKRDVIDKMLQISIRIESKNKQPYEMSLEAYATREFLKSASAEASILVNALYIPIKGYQNAHRKSVDEALLSGIDVDPRVLGKAPEIKADDKGPYERKARFVQDSSDVLTGVGGNLKNERIKENFVEIDGYGRVLAESFINRLIEKGRLPNEMRKKVTQRFTDEFYTEQLNKNIDLFPRQFEDKTATPNLPKEPYEMSQKEFLDNVEEKIVKERDEFTSKNRGKDVFQTGKGVQAKEGSGLRLKPQIHYSTDFELGAKRTHIREVKQAIDEGKIDSHPDYPELSKLYASKRSDPKAEKQPLNIKNVMSGMRKPSYADQEGMQRKGLIKELEEKIRKRGMEVALYGGGLDINDDPVLLNLKRELNKIVQEDAVNYARAIGD